MEVTVAGRFPIVSAGQHPLRAALEAWRARDDPDPFTALSDPAFVAAQAQATRELMALQAEAGVDLPSDGYVPVYDEWFAWSASVAGVESEKHIRYLDTNTYYHRWRITARPRRLRPGPHLDAYRRAAALSPRPVKPCLFGPFTIWAYALREGEGDTPAAFDALVDVWAAEIADLAAAGATYVQIDESPLLRPRHRGNVDLVERAIRRLAAAAPGVKLILHLACGAVDGPERGDGSEGPALLPRLLDLPVAGLGLDFTGAYRAPNLAALTSAGNTWGSRLLQAGVMDAREIRVEAVDDLRATLAAVAERLPNSRILAAPNAALLYVPRHAALDKLAALAQTAHAPAVQVLR
jgi:5-methyltetrahydropteroyltriglutamate--homocysteine methyltransferase